MVTTKKTSFPSLHSDQGHGLTKVWSKQEKKQITKLQNKEGLNASKSLGERRWEEGGLLEEGITPAEQDMLHSWRSLFLISQQFMGGNF